MELRRGFLGSFAGFSLVSSLVAVAIGAIVASLVATVITDAVKSQSSIINRDEMSEFALFVKDQLMTDKTCEIWLANQAFGASAQEFTAPSAGGYGDNPTGTIGAGFKFSNGRIVVKSLTIKNKGSINVQAPVDGKNTRRFVARVALSLTNNTGEGYRARYFEIPVLVDMDTKTVYKCNAEINLADACGALGLSFDPATNTCTGSGTTCLTGGSYIVKNGGGVVPNPATGAASCPSGFTPTLNGAVNIDDGGKKGPITYDEVYQCFKCT